MNAFTGPGGAVVGRFGEWQTEETRGRTRHQLRRFAMASISSPAMSIPKA
jgi:hypothetical protein